MNKTRLMVYMVVFLILGLFVSPVSAYPDGYLTIEFSKNTAKVGETVDLTLTAYNTGTVGWNDVILYVPVPDGLEYLSHYTTISKANYAPSSGLWVVDNMKHDLHGKTKTLYISFKVLSSAKEKKVYAYGKFTNIILESNKEHFENNISSASDTLTILKDGSGSGNSSGSGSGVGNGSGSGSGSGVGNGSGSGVGNGSGSGNNLIYQALFGKITNSDKFNNISSSGLVKNITKAHNTNGTDASSIASQSGSKGGGKKAYEINKQTQPIKTSSNTLNALLATLLIVGLMLTGYFKGMRDK